jgi:hypothetical protein
MLSLLVAESPVPELLSTPLHVAYVSHFLNAMTLHLAHHQNLPN